MIDPMAEELLTLAEAAKLVSKRRGNRRTHVSTIWRWCLKGVRGVLLEKIKIGDTWHTSREALARFFHAVTEAADPRTSSTRRTPAQRQRDSERAGRELRKTGAAAR